MYGVSYDFATFFFRPVGKKVRYVLMLIVKSCCKHESLKPNSKTDKVKETGERHF